MSEVTSTCTLSSHQDLLREAKNLVEIGKRYSAVDLVDELC